ncbi:MAG: GNAT family N-acetyltransferase [Mameliella sp.]|nr:GNAT family N-acetyltransferase [Mameliella sp.]
MTVDDLYLGEDWEYVFDEGVWAYKPDGVEVGVIELREEADCWWLDKIIVHPQHRRKGYGAIMLTTITQLDSRPVYLCVDGFGGPTPDFGPVPDTKLQAWYERFGWRVTGENEEGCAIMVRDPADFEDF